MILDIIGNLNKYTCLSVKFKIALKFLEDNKVEDFPEGKYEIDGDNVFILIQAYTSRDEKENKWESHKKHIDIQYILSGTETIGYKSVLELNLAEDFFEEKDIAFYEEVKLDKIKFASWRFRNIFSRGCS